MRRRTTRRKNRKGTCGNARLTQREMVRDAMLAARKSQTWLTLGELARLTGYGEASISAQLRHLRKPQYGRYLVIKRCRGGGKLGCAACGPLWEYRLSARRGKDGGVRELGCALTVAGERKRSLFGGVDVQKAAALQGSGYTRPPHSTESGLPLRGGNR